jgi:hypothetical protein
VNITASTRILPATDRLEREPTARHRSRRIGRHRKGNDFVVQSKSLWRSTSASDEPSNGRISLQACAFRDIECFYQTGRLAHHEYSLLQTATQNRIVPHVIEHAPFGQE